MIEPRQLGENVSLRLLRPDDASAPASAYVRNRQYLMPWEPARSEDYFTEGWQATDIASRLAAHGIGESYPVSPGPRGCS